MTEAMERAKARGSLGIALSDLATAAARAESVRTRHVRAGVDPDRIATALGTISPAEVHPRTLASDARDAVVAARTEAEALGHATVQPMHVWLGVLARPPVRAALTDQGLAIDRLRQAIVDSPTTDE